jgi:phage terminase large subunit
LPLLVSPEWVEERKVRWGVNIPIYQSKVLGEFPDGWAPVL